MNQAKRCLIIVSKYPEPGHVKTRLASDVGGFMAADLYAAFLADTLRTAAALNQSDILISFTPPESCGYYTDLAPDATLIPQPEGDLGRRLCHAFESAFELGYEKVAIIGSDTPHLTAERLEQALTEARGGTAVIGPSEDGGYYLLGLSAPTPALFETIDWGSERVFAQTKQQAESAGLRVRVLPEEFDVDTIDDLRKLDGFLRLSSPLLCPSTRAALLALTLTKAAGPG